jgi:hypothetical protein
MDGENLNFENAAKENHERHESVAAAFHFSVAASRQPADQSIRHQQNNFFSDCQGKREAACARNPEEYKKAMLDI